LLNTSNSNRTESLSEDGVRRGFEMRLSLSLGFDMSQAPVSAVRRVGWFAFVVGKTIEVPTLLVRADGLPAVNL